jgi:hypothetical protein
MSDGSKVGNAQMGQRECPYCLREFPDKEMTDDHVIARSWFPAKTPPVAKWKVRCCQACNNEKSAVEADVLGRLAWCLDPKRSDLADITARARRSIDPRRGKTPREIMHRFNRREAMRRSVVDIRSGGDPGVLPYFIENFEAGSRTGIEISAESLDGLVQMWVRGIHLREVGWTIPRGYEILVIHANDATRAQALSGVMEHAKIIQKGPGVEVKIFHAEEPIEFMTFYAFDIWNVLKFNATVERQWSRNA